MKYVIIGNSTAGIGAVEGIRQIDKTGEITIIASEPHHTYSRPLISYLLQGKTDLDKMKYRSDSFYEDNNCKFIHDTVMAIDSNGKHIVLSNGNDIAYDKLLVATGSSAFFPEQFKNLPNTHTFITLDDACKLEKSLKTDSGASKSSTRVLIIGAGLIGLKCAEGILDRVGSVTVADIASRILPAILDEESSIIVQKHLEDKGMTFKLGEPVTNTGEYDIVVVAAGVRPNVGLLEGIAKIDKGIIVNEKSETSVPDIYAAGDCTQSTDVSDGQSKIMALLPNAYMQGETAGFNMADGDKTPVPKTFDKAIPMNAVGLCGLHIITAGNYTGDVHYEGNNRFYCSNDKLNGYILIGDIKNAGVYTDLIRKKRPLGNKTLIIREVLQNEYRDYNYQ